jgi:DNA-3-methyladenine glycosylase II
LTERLDSAETLARHLAGLMRSDRRLRPIADLAGPFEIRKTEPGFAGMARVICGQQLSVASARAIWARFEALPGALEPQSYLGLEEPAVRATGFSAGKYRTVRAVAEAIASGEVDLDAVAAMPAANAVANLIKIKGIGPWTAEIYLMFCAGHPDIFPAGDLALQKAVAHALGLDARPDIKDLIAIAAAWAPHRHAAALLFWRYYAAIRQREGIAL